MSNPNKETSPEILKFIESYPSIKVVLELLA